ncbi:MAG: NPCBM/NEW2 domain-containing protein, partial [Bacilli bacterium]|nr:NPCBM/NEW2 domain-containing protein [Bacilli bacterium]
MCIVSLASIFFVVGLSTENHAYVESTIETYQYFTNRSDDSLYLSDIDYIANQSYARYDKIRYDEVNGGGKITVKIENNAFSFDKGIWAHANSQVTYDISNYDYKYFTAFVGLNTTSTRGDGVHFYIYTSEDGTNWGEAKFDEVKTPGTNATFVKVDISEANYIRLIANQIANNASDHAVYADAKLVNEVNESFAVKSVDEYNGIIKSQYNGESDITGELEFNLLKKELVQNVGQYTLTSFSNESEDNKAFFDWLMSNQKALRYYILGGKPTGSYYNSLKEFSRLYKNYKADFENKEVTKYGNSLGDLYLRMAVSLSLTHSHRVGLWINNASNAYNQSDSVRRYAIYRYMHKNGLLKGVNGADLAEWFEDYSVEEMRYVMATSIDDEEILWLNAYTQERIDKSGGSYLTPHPYIAYVTPNDDNPVFYAEENKDYFNDLFSVLDPNNEGQRIGLWDLEYTIPGGVDEPEYTIKIQRGYRVYKLWIVMRNKFGTGVVCGGISKTGTTIKGVHGIPAAVVGQPGHAAYIYYSRNSNGEGYWSLDNDVSGWAYSGAGSAGGAIPGSGRGLLGYSTGPYAKGDTGTYVALAQEVINHKDTYEQSQKLVYLASTYSDS